MLAFPFFTRLCLRNSHHSLHHWGFSFLLVIVKFVECAFLIQSEEALELEGFAFLHFADSRGRDSIAACCYFVNFWINVSEFLN